MKSAVAIFTLSSSLSSVLAASYSRSENIVGAGFYNAFKFEAISDLTHGRLDSRVNYVDKVTAQSQNLTFATRDTFILRADSKTVISDSSSVGRNSVRIRSNNAYTTVQDVFRFDIVHRPQGCGWETNEATWPAGGGVDIIEGVNDHGPNQITLHTNPGCTMSNRVQTGTTLLTDCDVNIAGNSGCGVNVGTPPSFGPTSLPLAVDGMYAIERTPAFISVWFWPRAAGNVPADVRAGGAAVNTGNWRGVPAANFSNTNCNMNQFFSAHNIIINLTFCGDWAEPNFSTCPTTCSAVS
ncbi:glycoside hydrolase family 16 protein [Mycena metata]|uniref:Glycoside hydrolase family 16 protein n=1 Tax=Mycena metata TaxID=1033252 RepID=A0AAD7J6V6_9AGAR|nr:glycoside hydrolase family 16 protein [Mycena metata]